MMAILFIMQRSRCMVANGIPLDLLSLHLLLSVQCTLTHRFSQKL